MEKPLLKKRGFIPILVFPCNKCCVYYCIIMWRQKSILAKVLKEIKKFDKFYEKYVKYLDQANKKYKAFVSGFTL